MSIWRRLLYYALGVGLGLLMVIFFFGDRDIGCSYFPNDRVLSDLRKKEVRVSASVRSSGWASKLDSNLIAMILLSGDIDFSKSSTKGEDSCNTYWIDYEDEELGMLHTQWANCDSTAYLLDVGRVE